MKRVALACLIVLPAIAAAQVPPTTGRPLPGTLRGRIDSLRRDTTARPVVRRDTTVRVDTGMVSWQPPDSVMRELLAKQGYDITRFQGARVTYDANSKDLRLDASKDQRAAVDRNGQTMASDSTIYYNQGSNTTTNLGCYELNLPGSTDQPIKGCGQVSYRASDKTSQFTHANVPFNNGENWFLYVNEGAAQVDTTVDGKGAATIYVRGGRITSCPDSVPDYYFSGTTMKRTSGGTVIARNVVLVVDGVPTLWLPFIFQNVKKGRVSGLLTTRFGISDIVRNSPTYHRNIENFGYYWALNDYQDATAWLDWRSGAGGSNPLDAGWLKLNGRWDYNWLDRFLSGSIATSYQFLGNGSKNFALNWGHSQQFSNDSRLSADINYVTNTTVQRQNTFDPYQAMATISSQANYSRKLGPASLSFGGTRRQYPGRKQVDQTFPTFQVSTVPIKMGKYVVWSPTFSFSASQSLNVDRQTILQTHFGPGGIVDTLKRNEYNTTMSFNSPLKLWEKDFSNSFSLRSRRQKFPELVKIYDVTTGDSVDTRIFGELYQTDIDWTPTFALPSLGQNKWNFSPGVSFANTDPGAFCVATERTNGTYACQSKRMSFSIGATPTFYGLFRGFGPFAAFRHTVTPGLSYTYAPPGRVSDAYLLATGRSHKGYLGGLQVNSLSFGLNTSIEAKLAGDSARGGGSKIKVLGLTMSSFSYNFERLRAPEVTSTKWWRGLTTDRFDYSVTSDLLPGIQFGSSYSLFQGDITSDTAVFSPFRENMSASMNFSRDANPFTVLAKLFGKSPPPSQRAPVAPVDSSAIAQQDSAARERARAPVAGARTADRFVTPPSGGWRLALTLSSSQQRAPKGGNIVELDPTALCRTQFNDPFQIEQCENNARLNPTHDNNGLSRNGAPVYISRPSMNIGANLGFNLTPRWAVSWNTNFDAQEHEFAMHTVSLQRDLHDWRAIFGFTQSVNGNFAFNFSVALKAQPDLKFDYARNTIGSRSF